MMVESLLWGWKKSRLWQEILFQQSLPAALLLLLLSHSNNLCLLLHPAALPTGAPDFRKQVFTATKESSSFLTADFVLNYSKVQCVKTSLSLSTSWLVVLLSGWLVGHLGTWALTNGRYNELIQSQWNIIMTRSKMVVVGWLAGWLSGWLICWLAGWLVGRLAGWLAGCYSVFTSLCRSLPFCHHCQLPLALACPLLSLE